MRETERTDDGKKKERKWPKQGELKLETEIPLCTSQKQALQVNVVKYSIDKTSNTTLSRPFNEKIVSITQIVTVYFILARTQYKNRHDKVGPTCNGSCVRSIT